MLINDTSLLTEETRKRLNDTGFIHIHTDGPLTEETALDLLKWVEENEHILTKEIKK